MPQAQRPHDRYILIPDLNSDNPNRLEREIKPNERCNVTCPDEDKTLVALSAYVLCAYGYACITITKHTILCLIHPTIWLVI